MGTLGGGSGFFSLSIIILRFIYSVVSINSLFLFIADMLTSILLYGHPFTCW